MAEALIAFGANLGDARVAVDRAIEIFCDGRACTLLKRSSDYRTPPWGVADQPAFVNACISVATELPPRDLLAHAHAVEREFGRNRIAEQRWGPRSLDIDIIAFDEVVLDEPGLTLPHPRLFERAFVLVPLAEIAPERIVAGRRIGDALKGIDQAGIVRLP
jgi:2-amino-4-hydroxy-6-hydroxymethyldihydropteridine diphosphokinase